jgi:hypothetical protein
MNMYELVPSWKRRFMRFASKVMMVAEVLLMVFVITAHHYHPHTVTTGQLLLSVLFGVAGILGSLVHLCSLPRITWRP